MLLTRLKNRASPISARDRRGGDETRGGGGERDKMKQNETRRGGMRERDRNEMRDQDKLAVLGMLSVDTRRSVSARTETVQSESCTMYE